MSDDQSTERWRDIEGFHGYQISDRGNVRSRIRKGRNRQRFSETWHIIRQTVLPHGYHQIKLTRQGKRHHLYVHRLVLEAFVGPCPPGQEARHVGENDRSNNTLDNLCWGTRQENSDDAARHGTRARGSRVGSAKLTEEQATRLLQEAASGESIISLSARYRIRKENVSKIVNGHHYVHIDGPRKPDGGAMRDCITTAEAAVILGVTSVRVQQLVKAGVIVATACRKGFMVTRDSVQTALARPGQRKKRQTGS